MKITVGQYPDSYIRTMAHTTCFGKSDTGLCRSNNEDAFVLNPGSGFMALADGMGGSASGEVASKIFIDTADEVFRESTEESTLKISRYVQKTFQMANERILKMSHENPDHQGMGCTAELIAFAGRSYVLGHVGDSRTYLFRESELRQITRDHSVVQDQVDQGIITIEEARKHALRHVIHRSIGTVKNLVIDLIIGEYSPGDLFLLCSDGLTDMVNDASIVDTLSQPLHLSKKVDSLIKSANSCGGHDNITVILCEPVAL
jgi:protein phosphatase